MFQSLRAAGSGWCALSYHPLYRLKQKLARWVISPEVITC